MRKQLLKWMSLGSIALAVLLFAVERAAADDDDPPSRVARLAYTNGNISFNPAGTDDWVAEVVKRPMTTGSVIGPKFISRGHRAVPVAEVDAMAALKEHGTAAEIATKLAEHKTLKEESTTRARQDKRGLS